MTSPGHWKCGSQSPQSCLWLDQSDVARMVPLTGDFGRGVGFGDRVGQGFGLFRIFCEWQTMVCWVGFGISGWNVGKYQVGCKWRSLLEQFYANEL